MSQVEQEYIPILNSKSRDEKPRMFWALMCSSILLTFMVYLPVLNNGFVNWDDPFHILYNLHIRNLNTSSLHWIFTNMDFGYWIPLTWLSYSADYYFGKLDPEIYHMHNLILHCLNTALVYLLSYKILMLVNRNESNDIENKKFVSMISALLTAIIFGIHPLHVESVAWATERKDVLYSLFFLSSILVYLDNAVRPKIWKYCISFALFMLSLSAKPMAITLPFVLVLLDFWPLGRFQKGIKSVLLEKIPHIIAVAVFGCITVIFQTSKHYILDFDNVPLSFRIMNSLHSLILYLKRLIFPTGLMTLYPVKLSETFTTEYIFTALLCLSIVFTIWILRKKRPYLMVAFIYYLVTLAPVVGLVQVGTQSSADRYTYLPLLGPILLFSTLLTIFLHKRRLILLIFVGVITTSLAYVTPRQVGTWKDSITLWENVLKIMPRNASKVYGNLGDAYLEVKRLDEAIAVLNFAIKIDPQSPVYYDARGTALLKQDKIEESIQDFKTAISMDQSNDSPYYHLALAYAKKGMFTEALAESQAAIKINTNDPESYNVLGLVYKGLKQYGKSIEAFRKALSLEPNNYNPTFLKNLKETCIASVKNRNLRSKGNRRIPKHRD